jgi:hypothetical protein
MRIEEAKIPALQRAKQQQEKSERGGERHHYGFAMFRFWRHASPGSVHLV